MSNLLIIGEGQGEVLSAGRLAARLLARHGTNKGRPFKGVLAPRRMGVLRQADLERACEVARSLAPAALLITSDLEDSCPGIEAPRMANIVRALNLPFPAAIVLFYREYETLFLAAAESLAGAEIQLGSGPLKLNSEPAEIADPESKRDAKGWVSKNLMPGNQKYKPTVHQEPLTRTVDINALRASNLSSFRRLESALRHLATEVAAQTSEVYPIQART